MEPYTEVLVVSNRRWWAECLAEDCNWKSNETLTDYWADVEGNNHFVAHRLDTVAHSVILCHRDIEV